MEHPSEHSIELFVLQAPLERAQKERIEAHLNECAGCRSLAEAASSFYADLRVDMLTRPASPPSDSRSLPVASGRMPAIFEPPFRGDLLSRIRPAGPVRRFVRSHPYVTGGGMLALLAGLTLLMLTFNLMPSRDLNPGTVILNYTTSTLDAYNRSGERLWSYPVPHLGGFVDHEGKEEWKFLQLADLNGDGKNEIITTLPLASGEFDFTSIIHILDYEKNEVARIKPGRTISYHGRIYPDEFHTMGFSIGDFSGSGRKEIFVVSNHVHSPSVVSRYDADGKLMGTLWHFGSLHLIGNAPLKDGARDLFVLYGASDIDEGNYTLVIMGVDPSRLTGNCESSYSGGFGLPKSSAEAYYVHIPPSEVAKRGGVRMRFGSARVIPLQDGEGFRIWSLGEPDSVPVQFEYFFKSDFRIVEVKSENLTKAVYDHLVAKGRPGESFFDDYMKVVAGEIRYWNGHHWQSQPTPVMH
jgi:hypothetical protein